MLSQRHTDIVKSTVPLLEEAGPAVTEHFYQRMFSHNPELKHIFNLSNQHSGRQQFALFSAIAAYAKHLDTPQVLAEMVDRIANKHTSLNIRSEHYPIVGQHLIATLQELLPEQFTAEVQQAWELAYQQLADIFIRREDEIYLASSSSAGGWSGGREFVLTAKRPESELVSSFVFVPQDRAAVAAYKPGQYIGIEVQPEGCEFRQIRQYSLSSAALAGQYQISVKREINGRPGVVSNYLHDDLAVGDRVVLYPPVGDFYLQPGEQPLVLISAGVGVTPMQAMLEHVCQQQPGREVHFLHACENPQQHSFAARQRNIKKDMNLSLHYWYRQPVTPEQSEGRCYSGLMDIAAVADLPRQQGEFYICGPVPFMSVIRQQLLAAGVTAERIHYEVFGPHQGL